VIEVRAASPEHYPWIAQKANLVISNVFRALEAVSGDRILGMVGYDAWTPNSCAMHVAIEEPIAIRRLIHKAFEIPFVSFGRGVIFGSVLSTNPRALALDLHLGFRELARLRDAWMVGIDLILLEMRREDCRWLRK